MAETILTTIHDQIDRMSAALQKLGQYILTHVHDVPKMNVSVLAEKSEVSQATVVRFAKALGYEGFTEFRLQLASENVVVNAEDANLFSEISPHDTAEELKVKLSSRVENAITTTSRRLPAKTLDSAANLLSWANVMSVFGIGASSVVANDFYQKFSRLGKPVLNPPDVHQAMTNIVTQNMNHVMVLISNSGLTQEVIKLAKASKENDVPTIVLTADQAGQLSKTATLVIPTDEGKSPDHLRTAATTSLLSQLYVVDLIFYRYLQLHFNENVSALSDSYKIIKQFLK